MTADRRWLLCSKLAQNRTFRMNRFLPIAYAVRNRQHKNMIENVWLKGCCTIDLKLNCLEKLQNSTIQTIKSRLHVHILIGFEGKQLFTFVFLPVHLRACTNRH